ncbi:carbohydrate kinase [Microbacterium sp. No. 7]|uniref:carbohydrate kinase family protein n=1 Tax=Microbacterium sp. No. 7 TaxID=1714373 RepID=UPI003009FD75
MADPRVLVIGEALVDIVVTGDGSTEHPGGSPANVALGLARRGRDVDLLTRLGGDPRASMIVRHLERSGVEVLSASFTDRATSLARATLVDDGSARYDFDIDWRVPASLPDQRPDLVHTGSLAAFLEPGAAQLVKLLDELRPAVVTLDPNIRPDLLDHAPAVAQFEALTARATIVKLSDEDAAWLYPGKTIEAVLSRIRSLGPRLVACTLGADGAVLVAEEAQVRVPAVSVAVADTIGAGDAFMAALIDDYLTESGASDRVRLEHIGRRAASAAAITVSRPGADLPWASELVRTDSSERVHG